MPVMTEKAHIYKSNFSSSIERFNMFFNRSPLSNSLTVHACYIHALLVPAKMIMRFSEYLTNTNPLILSELCLPILERCGEERVAVVGMSAVISGR